MKKSSHCCLEHALLIFSSRDFLQAIIGNDNEVAGRLPSLQSHARVAHTRNSHIFVNAERAIPKTKRAVR